MPKIIIDKSLCKSCGICVEFCPVKILYIGDDVNEYGYRYVKVSDANKCTLCYLCERYCPEFAIKVEKE